MAAGGKMTALVICPECRDGKHQNCIGYALDAATDIVGECQCKHREAA